MTACRPRVTYWQRKVDDHTTPHALLRTESGKHPHRYA